MLVYKFVHELKYLSKKASNIEENDNVDKLNKDLKYINELYDRLIKDNTIKPVEKEFILSIFIKFKDVNINNIDSINIISRIIENKYNTYHCIDSYLSNILE